METLQLHDHRPDVDCFCCTFSLYKEDRQNNRPKGSTESTIVIMNGELFNRFHSMVAW